MSAVSELEHVLVLCTDIEATREFYERAVGLRAGDRPPLQFDGYWLYAGETPCLHIADRAQYAAHAQTLGLAVGTAPAGPGGPGGPADPADPADRADQRGRAARSARWTTSPSARATTTR